MGKEVTVGYRYYLGLHFGICKGPVDALTAINVGERNAWIGGQASNGQFFINSGQLFGGDEREGGIEGYLELMMGAPTQAANAWLQANQGARQSGYRGIFTAVWKGGLVSANNPYLKPWHFRVRRILAGWRTSAGTTAWYPEKAEVPLAADAGALIVAEFGNDLAETGWFNWSVATQNGTLSDGPYGRQLDVPSQNTAGSTAKARTISGAGTKVTNYRYKFMVSASNSDDGLFLSLYKNGGTTPIISFNSRREGAFDSLRRIHVYIGPSLTDFAFTAATLGTWYQLDVTINPTTAAWVVTITDIAAGTVHGTASGGSPGSNWNTDADFLAFGMDGGGPTCPTSVAELTVTAQIAGIAMNPAHIVYECLTNLEWGMGYGTSAINDTNFRAAADVFRAESMGLCLEWNQQQPIESFVQVVLDHAGAVLAQDPVSALFVLTPLRGGYTVGSLPLFDASNIIEVASYEKAAITEAVNEITVKYDDLVTGRPASVKVQNLAAITAAGGAIARTTTYPGFATASLASRAGMRDLVAGSSPLARVRLRVNRAAYQLLPGGLIRFTWPKLSITTMVLRVLKINLGQLAKGEIELECIEDVFGLPSASYAKEQPSGWTSPNTQPASAASRLVREAHYYEIVRDLGTSDTLALANDAGFVVAAAVRPSGDSLDFGMFTRVGAAAFAEQGRGAFAPSGRLTAALEPAATSATLNTLADESLVDVGTYAQVDQEIVRVDAWNALTGALTLGRGLFGTPASRHDAGARVFFVDGFLAVDDTERVDGEVVDVRLLPRTGLGQLAIASAPQNTITLDQLAFRPFAPGQLRINGALYPPNVVGTASFSWKHRDRLQQNLEGDESGDIGPEASTVYNTTLRLVSSNTTIDSASGLTGTGWMPATQPSEHKALYRIDLQSEIGGLVSAQSHRYTFQWFEAHRVTASLITGGARGNSGCAAPGRTLVAEAMLWPGLAYVTA